MNTNLPERKSQSRDEIISILTNILEKKKKFVIWQNQNDTRVLNQATIKSINLDNNSFVLEPAEAKTTKFKNRDKIYLKSEEKNLLFKENLSFASDKLMILPLPKEFYVEELRKFPRKTFRVSDEVPFVFMVKNKFSHILETMECTLLDYSEKGLAFHVDSTQVTAFDKNETIYICRISNMLFEPKITAKIAYAKAGNKLSNKGKISYRVGVKFVDRDLKELFH
jgi:hypothetical protein